MNRRSFLRAGAAVTALSATHRWIFAEESGAHAARLTVDLSGPHTAIPAGFTGLSYETEQLAHPGYFSAQNKDLVGLFKTIGPRGVLRIGGNTSDYAIWSPGTGTPTGEDRSAPVGPDAGAHALKSYAVTPQAIAELKTFLDATGWSLIYGINLGHGTPERAATEASYVVNRIGGALVALQIGNEPDLYFKNGIRSANYDYAGYIAEWKKSASAIRQKTPHAPLAGPDVANHSEWAGFFAKDAGDVQMLTTHYYAEGPPSDPKMNIDRLLRSSDKNRAETQKVIATSNALGIPYRLAEGNSCYHGGKAGVSDVFASALWGADYMLAMAGWGGSGINFHGGGQGFYTPIAGGGTQPFVARPLLYGMLFFREFAQGAAMLPVKLNAGDVNLTAYAAITPSRQLQIALVNKDAKKDASVEIAIPELRGAVKTRALLGSALDSASGVTFAGSEVSANGGWTPQSGELQAGKDGGITVNVPKGSALLLTSVQPLSGAKEAGA